MLAEQCVPDLVVSVESKETRQAEDSYPKSYRNKSSSHLPNNSKRPCKYFQAKQTCRFGSSCRYSHSSISTFSAKDTFDYRPKSGEDPQSLNCSTNRKKSGRVCSHYLKSTCRYGSECVYRHPVQPPHFETRTARNNSDVKEKKCVPSERNFGAFLMSPVAHKNVETKPPKAVPTKLREVEIEQIEAYCPDYVLLEKGKHGVVYRISHQPSEPKWQHDEIILEVFVPGVYPEKPISVKIPEHELVGIEGLEYVNHIFEQFISSDVLSSDGRSLRQFLIWFDKNINTIFEDVVSEKEYVQDSHSDDESEVSDPSDLEDEGLVDTKSEDVESVVALPMKYGTEIRLHGLNMTQSVATVSFSNVKVVIVCTRCKLQEDVNLKANSPIVESCSRCHSSYSITYRPSLIHAASSTIGFLILNGCNPLYLVLLDCVMNIVCLECNYDNNTRTMMFGQWKECWCRRCHSKLSILAEQSKFVQHKVVASQGGEDGDVIPLKSKPKKKDFILKLGTPLPESGTCSHYGKSHRWFRFPCCGKMYPCDVCHDLNESHSMERATRMICGHCSTEQVYTTSKPCLGCGSDMASVKHTAYWEGGKGCRSRMQMSRKDKHKYSSSAKTSSQKLERVGEEGKRKRN